MAGNQAPIKAQPNKCCNKNNSRSWVVNERRLRNSQVVIARLNQRPTARSYSPIIMLATSRNVKDKNLPSLRLIIILPSDH